MKLLLHRWTFIAVAITTLFFSCDSPKYDTAITTVLQQDAAIVPAANGDYKAVVAAMRQLDLSLCPSNFATAFLDHIHAWERAEEIQNTLALVRSEDNVENVLIETGLQKIFGSSGNALKDALEQEAALKQKAAIASAEIKETYDVVESIAVSYRASLPKK